MAMPPDFVEFTPRKKPEGIRPLQDPMAVAAANWDAKFMGQKPLPRTHYKSTEGHDRLQAKFALLSNRDLFRLLCRTRVVDGLKPEDMPQRIVLEKPAVVDRYSRANDWRLDAVIEAPGLHVIVEIKPRIDSMGELLGQCQRYMRHYRPDYLQDGEFCPVIVACPAIEGWILEVLEAQGFYWLANERWDEFFGVQP
jgi:hypothetical protein